MTDYLIYRDTLAYSIFAAMPQDIYNSFKCKIQDMGLDNWDLAVEALRAWSKYTRKLEEQIEILGNRTEKDRCHD